MLGWGSLSSPCHTEHGEDAHKKYPHSSQMTLKGTVINNLMLTKS